MTNVVESLKAIPPGSVFFVQTESPSTKRVHLLSPVSKIERAGIYLGSSRHLSFSVEKEKVIRRSFLEFLYGRVTVFWYTKATVGQIQQLKTFLYDYVTPVCYPSSVDFVYDVVNICRWPWISYSNKRTVSEIVSWLESEKAKHKFWSLVWRYEK